MSKHHNVNASPPIVRLGGYHGDINTISTVTYTMYTRRRRTMGMSRYSTHSCRSMAVTQIQRPGVPVLLTLGCCTILYQCYSHTIV